MNDNAVLDRVTTDRVGSSDVVEPVEPIELVGATHRLVDPDPDALDRAIERILAEEDERNSIAARIDRVASIRRQQATLAARELTELAELWQLTRAELPHNATGAETDHAWRSLAAELAVANRASDRTMTARLNDAYIFTEHFPSTLKALHDGTISLSHARIIADNGIQLDDTDTRARYENAMVERAATLSPGRLTRIARHAAEQLTTTSLTERHQAAREQRRITKHDLQDGMSEIIALLPTPLADAIWERLTSQAKTLHDTRNPDSPGTEDPRTRDQVRADLFAELLLTGEPSGCPDAPHSAANGIRAHISITIPALTLLGRSNEPATLAGGAPIDLETATRLAADAPTLTRIITHPISGQVLAVDQYRPSEELRRYLRHRDKRCRFPSCNQQAHRCDIDHTIDAQHGGPTSAGNLACLCRNHHVLKHHTPWTVQQTSPGVLHWTSPHGRVITDTPDTHVRFT